MLSSRGRVLIVTEAVDGREEGAGAGVWVQGRQRRGRDGGRQREGGGRAKFAWVVGAVAAEEDEGWWGGGSAAEGAEVAYCMLWMAVSKASRFVI